MISINFKYSIDDAVITPFGDGGIISMCALDDGGIVYFVKTSKDDKWFKESQLVPQIDTRMNLQ